MSLVTVTMRQMLEAGMHFGHKTRHWNPKMAPFIFGKRSSIHIINLEKTVPLLEDALNMLSKLSSKGGTVLFVGTKRAAKTGIAREAVRCGMPFINQRWLGGTVTNFHTIRRSIKRLKELEGMEEDGLLERLTKKEALLVRRDKEKLDKSLGGIRTLEALPDAIFIIDVGHERNAVVEANKKGIPVIGVVDTNNSPEGIDYVIPSNDDATSSIDLMLGLVADTIITGRETMPIFEGNSEDFVAEEEVTKMTARRHRTGRNDRQNEQKTGAILAGPKKIQAAENDLEEAETKHPHKAH